MSEDDNETHGGITAKIIVKGKDEIERLEKELEAERIEKEDLASKLELIAEKQFAKALEKAKSEGAPSDISTVEELEEWKEKQEKEKNRNPALSGELGTGGSGKAPLSSEPSGSISGVKEYADYGEMIEDLHKRASSNNEEVRNEAKEILAKLTEKGLKTKKAFSFEKEIDLGKMAKEKAKAHIEACNKAGERGE